MELQKAVRSIKKFSVGWEKDVDKCKQIVDVSLQYSHGNHTST